MPKYKLYDYVEFFLVVTHAYAGLVYVRMYICKVCIILSRLLRWQGGRVVKVMDC